MESKDGIITVNLQDGEIHEIDLENYDHYRKIKFGTHQIIISMNDLLLNRTNESNRTDREMKVPAMIEKIKQNKISIEQIKKRIETVKSDIGIDSDSQIDLAGIMNQIQILKDNTTPDINENRDYNKEIPAAEYEEKAKLRSLNNNARQFQNEFTLIENYEKNNNKFLVEIHKKFTLAVACILFTLVGAPLGILVRKGGITIASALSIAFFLIYYILLIWGEQLADRALLDPAIGSWMPNIVLLIVGLIILFLSDRKN